MKRPPIVVVLALVLAGCGEEEAALDTTSSTVVEDNLPRAETSIITEPLETTSVPTTAAPTTVATAPPTTKAPATATTQALAPPQSACHPSYRPCVPVDVSDVDCEGGSGNGPAYTGRVEVVGPDEYDLDRDGDGVGCE